MTTKKDTREPRKKLVLKKQTIRDLTTKRDAADAVRAGAPVDTNKNTCGCPSTLPLRC